MVDRVEALVLQMSVDLRKLQTGMQKARETTNKELQAVEKRVGQSAKILEDLSGKISGGFEDLARNIPIVGDSLAALGPAALAGGAALGGLALGAKTLWDNAEAARKSIDDLKTSSENIGTSAETAQALRALGIELDVTFETIEKGLNKLQVGSAEAANGQGNLFNALRKTNPEILATIAAAQTQEDRWDALSRAISGTDDQLQKVAIAKAAFGKEGAKFVRLLDGEDKTIQSLTNRYRELGVILEEDLVTAVGEADQRIQLANARMEANATRANAAWIPAVEALSTAWADLNVNVGTFFDTILNDQGDRQFQTITKNLKDINEEIAALEKTGGTSSISNFLFGVQDDGGKSLQALKDKRALLELDLEIRRQQVNRGPIGQGDIEDPAEAQRREGELSRLAAERNRQRQAAALILASLGDTTQAVKLKEAEYNELVRAGLLTRTQATEAVELYRKSLEKADKAQRELSVGERLWQELLKASETPVTRAEANLREFWDAVSAGTIGPPEQAQEVLIGLTKALQDAQAAAAAATPEFQAVAAARQAIAQAEASRLTTAEKITAERQRLNDLVGKNGFTQAEADQAFGTFVQEQTTTLRENTREAVKQGLRQGLVTDDWGTALREIVAENLTEGLNDTIDRLADLLSDILLGKPGGDGGALSAIWSAISGSFGGARAGGGGVMAGRSYLVGEKGPEILRMGPGQNGEILNAEQVNALAAPAGGGTYIDARTTIGGVDFATWPQVQAALAAQTRAIAARVPGAVNATLASNRTQKRRF